MHAGSRRTGTEMKDRDDARRGSCTDKYRALLLEGFVPFWFRHGIDWECGGVLSCMHEDGILASEDKFTWSQARSVWTFSALYNRIEPRREFLRAAENSVRFLLAHGRDPQGRWVYSTDRKGNVLEGPTSIYADCFVVYGFSEYYRATQDQRGACRCARNLRANPAQS